MNPFDFIKDMKNIQAKAEEARASLSKISAIGSAGAGMVVVEITGEMEVIRVNIDKIAIADGDVSMLEDLVLSATNQAISEVKEKIKAEAANLMPGGINPFSMFSGN